MHQKLFGGYSVPRPTVGSYSAPSDILAGFMGKGSEGREKVRGRGGREGEGR